MQRHLAGQAPDAGVEASRMRHQLLAHARAGAVGADQHVGMDCRTVLEMRDDRTIRLLLVA